MLTPGRDVGAVVTEADGVPFEGRFAELKELCLRRSLRKPWK